MMDYDSDDSSSTPRKQEPPPPQLPQKPQTGVFFAFDIRNLPVVSLLSKSFNTPEYDNYRLTLERTTNYYFLLPLVS